MDGDVLLLALSSHDAREMDVGLDLLWGFDKGRHEAGNDVPFYMAMELKVRFSRSMKDLKRRVYQPDARVICAETKDYEAVWTDLDGVSSHWILWEGKLH